MKNIKFSLAWQILFAMVLGILLGSYLHYHSDSRDWLVVNLLSPAGDIFIHLIKMIVVPIVISTLVVGQAHDFGAFVERFACGVIRILCSTSRRG